MKQLTEIVFEKSQLTARQQQILIDNFVTKDDYMSVSNDKQELIDRTTELELQVERSALKVKSMSNHRTFNKQMNRDSWQSEEDDLKKIIKQKDFEYERLENELRETFDELEYQKSSRESAERYVELMRSRSSRTVYDPEIAEKNEQLEAAEQEIESLKQDLKEAKAKWSEEEEELNRYVKQEEQIKQKLDLHPNATKQHVLKRIQELVDSRQRAEAEAQEIRDEIERIESAKMKLHIEVESLRRSHGLLEQTLRRKELMRNEAQRRFQHRPTNTPQPRVPISISYIKLNPFQSRCSYDASSMKIIRRLTSTEKPASGVSRYCLLCRQDPNVSRQCMIHYKTIRHGRWQCCNDECSYAAGCMRTRHWYVEKLDGKIIFTDGEQSVILELFL